MATVKCTLIDGLAIGDDVLKNVVMRDATAGDIIEAQEDSEKPVLTPDGYELMSSPALLAINVMRRQIVSIDDNQGPISMAEIKKLSPADLSLIQEKTDELDQAIAAKIASSAVTQKGRS